MRKVKLENGEIYHIYNRGVDKRKIFSTPKDLERFFKSMKVFNCIDPIGSLHEQSFQKDKVKKPLVKFIAYNLLPNHFHFILEQVAERGISEFMKRLLGGYTWYFNKKNKRSGSLFQGTFKSKYIDSDGYLLYASVYVNLNDKIPLGGLTAKWTKSSWNEYINEDLCKPDEKICLGKDIILKQFNSIEDYKKFAFYSLEYIKFNKEKYKELEE